MKKQAKSTLRTLLQSLGLVSLIFFGMAFACGDDKNNGGKTDTGGGRTPKKSGGLCTTENEFKAAIPSETTRLILHDYEENVDVDFHRFEVGEPTHYQNTYERFQTVTDNAYPVNTDFDVLTLRKDGTTYRSRYVNASYMCYPVPRSGKGQTCVCFGEKNATSASEDVIGEEK